MTEPICPKCGKNKTVIHKRYGLMDCNECAGKYARSTGKYPEFFSQKMGDRIRGDREKFAPDTVQPTRGGEASGEFCKIYPEEAKKMFTKKEIKNAKPLWKDLKGLRRYQ